ncbi:hypothetical protein COT44_04640 [Candidatus Shapirobacteria bacterium CG08_land_8_20_14_0_20_39_18]|uniref:UDP-N-acetylglucosamine--N-acetylmuramyl-(pentapeptide) pyrophosphoryl-undecaprenol N-acetylglucosamine transferase n=1 Tax=Candidatus Shapirobacteria bacterium CG08_land_8_20_14_0_20_39_18 TaxID=1974883 RepID=A0A2M6XC10_9BACT|nr:MAG: hypothetical protein COT44_04640 [Candidatus Shapirobacteria bacterium CG08_land_8_20_14_0_20_39_18]PIY65342.1 MAG: hypothetical protein COY91_02930 [Candidatus Shapirobacteria bacterium CG_4_10_14_0_8_um_filter_39_15]PJE68193.1 MAG: hypothetical protein COU94_03105 [Candidatus Shapirobacteria bacterium CG10_big_fil_rev_8_21_14_0_10_38_8]
MMKKIVITGGHLTPAQAVISELKKGGGWEIYYFGRKHSLEGDKTASVESKVIPELGATFISITTGRLQRQFSRYTIPSLLRIPLGLIQSFYWLWKIKPNVVCSFGGYVSVPVVFSAWILRIPILTHEQTITFGLSSKINSLFVNKIAVSFSDSVKHFPADKVVLTGNPIRQEIFIRNSKFPYRVNEIRNSKLPIIYITGGNQGSRLINNAVLGCLPELLKKYAVIHQCGELDYEKLNKDFGPNYLLFPYINSQQIGWVMNHANLIVSRAGANTVCEVAALGKPTLFIPIPWTYQDEQTKNALMLKKIGIAEILYQKDLTSSTLLEKINKMMEKIDQYHQNGSQAKKLIKLNAAEILVNNLNEIAKK